MTEPRQEVIDEFKTLIQAIFERHGAGCCLHVAIDDCNIADHHVEFCVNYAKEYECAGCVEAGELMQTMTLKERAIALRMGWCTKCERYSCCGICHDCNGPVIDPEKGN